MSRSSRAIAILVTLASALAVVPGTAVNAQETRPVEMPNEALWYVSASLGTIQFEGDEELDDGFMLKGRIGYDYSEWWSFEGALHLAPALNGNDVGYTEINESGVVESGRRKRGEDTWGAGLAVDALFHFTRWERVDPFLAIGGGFMWYGKEVNGEQFDPAIRVGGGVMYHFNDEWAVRADARTFIAGHDTEANATIDGGVVWTWGAHLPPDYVVTGGPADSDGDGLLDSKENEIGTDPYDPDTDKDGLTDGEEVNKYRTDPLNPDTDYDLLKDGEEVHKYKTDPLVADTDKGGVSDGHEVLEDGTDPLNGADDLYLITLHIEFDTDQAVIKPAYFRDIDVVGKTLSRSPGATAVVEGHADKRRTSSNRHNKRLSERRAEAVVEYLEEKSGIAGSRLKAEGYGFARPIAPNDPVNGNALNRRVEVYIRGLSDTARSALDAAR